MNVSEFLDPTLLGLLPVGVIVGVLAAILGIGGGLLMVPTLTFMGATPVQAVATSLVGVVLGSASGTVQNWRMKQLNLKRIALLAPPAMLTTELGVWLANRLPPALLLLSFAALQVVSIYLVGLKRKLKKAKPKSTASKSDTVRQTHKPESSDLVSTSANIQNPDNTPEPAVYRYSNVASIRLTEFNTGVFTSQIVIFQTQAIGLMAGLLSGLFGVGGGIVMVPLQMLFLGESIKDAVRTSLGAVALISIWAVGRHALSGNVLWLDGIYLGLGGLFGAQLGARLLPKLPDAVVSLMFRLLLALLAVYMVIKAQSL